MTSRPLTSRPVTSRPVPRHPFLDHPGLLAFAHRGGMLGAPENTMAAFERAVRLGYRYLETDARVTADGRLLAFHDARLERSTDAAGAVARLPWRTVRAARVAGREPIPLLEEVLGAFPGTRFNIDVKSAAAVRPLLAAVRRTGAWDRVCVGAFSDARLAAVRAAAGPRLATSLGPRAVLGLRLRSLSGPVPADRLLGGRVLGAAARRQAVCVQVPARYPVAAQPQDTGAVVDRAGGRGLRVVDRAFVRAAHRLGLQVHVWTVDDPRLMRELIGLGVDGIMSDRVDVLRDVLVEHGRWSG
ncbi:glycerophosphodiester phosphodiesterase [Streptomyces sp. NPDC092296]|uniref:glycerophosphodiester phosphodiesterase n=1 Tax=Streptomyces sp. NPDC092296 TaxID=3366012 RepID=UPI003809C052